MKINLKVSSKMHLFIIITCIIVAIGIAVGTACHFAANGYFNYSAEWSDYKAVTVTYTRMECSPEKVEEICNKAFDDAGVSRISLQKGKAQEGGILNYKFDISADNAKLEAAEAAIRAEIVKIVGEKGESIKFTDPAVHEADTLMDGGKALMMAGIALAALVAFHCVYFIVRYKISMALGALLADAHTLALYLSILSLSRIPVGASMFAFGVLAVMCTVIGTCILFGKMRKNFKDEAYSSLGCEDVVDSTVSETCLYFGGICVALLCATIMMFFIMALSAMSAVAVFAPIGCMLVAVVVSLFSVMLFTPSVYTRFRQIGEKHFSNKKAANKKVTKQA